MVQLPALRNRHCGRGRNRVAVDGGAAWQPVAGISALPGKGGLRCEVSQAPRARCLGHSAYEAEPAVFVGALHREYRETSPPSGSLQGICIAAVTRGIVGGSAQDQISDCI